MCVFFVVFFVVVVCLFVCFLIADNIFHLGVHYVYYYMLVQRFEPQGRSLTNFHYYYCSVHMIVIIVSHILIYFDVCYFLLGVFIKFISSNFVRVLLHYNTQFISRKKDATFYLNKRSSAEEDVRARSCVKVEVAVPGSRP